MPMPHNDDVPRPEGMEDAEVVIRLMDTPLAERLGAFLLNGLDLHLAWNWFGHASLASDETPTDLGSRCDAHFHAAVAAYRRCCNEGKRHKIKGQKGSWRKSDTLITEAHATEVLSDGAALHKQLIELGNRLVGHSSPEFERAAVGARCLWKREQGFHALIDGTGFTLKHLTVGKEQLERFGVLCFALEKHYVQPEIDRMQVLLDREVRSMTPEQIFMLPVFLTTWGDQVYNPIDPGHRYPKPEELPTDPEDM
jgi:hypothetical protein